MKWRSGDRAVVTGDSANWHHHFPEGTEVILKELDKNARRTVWRCVPVKPYEWTNYDDDGNPVATGDKTGEDWWVCTEDLEPPWVEPTEKEVLEAFGIVAKPHCSTCTCNTD